MDPDYRISLDALVGSARVPVEQQVEEQDEVVVPRGEAYSGDAAGMGMPRLAGSAPF
jgi:hypothetical protein